MTATAGHATSARGRLQGGAEGDDPSVRAVVREGAGGAEEGDAGERRRRMDKARRDVIREARGATASVHAGERVRTERDLAAVGDQLITPIAQNSTYTFANTRQAIEYNTGDYGSYEYCRYGSSTARAAEMKLMALEGAEDALVASSGMNSATTMLLALVPQGGHVVTTTDCYRRTRQFMNTVLPKMGIRCTVIDPADVEQLARIFEAEGASLFFSESPTNPMIRVVDTPAITKLCKRYGVISCIDTTFCSPINYRPIEHGADLVLHSGTKYLAGHHDVLCGALCGRADLIDTVRGLHGVLGGVLDPHAAYLLLRGMKTLPLRVEAHNRNAEAIAAFLETHPKVHRVHYPTQKSHPDYAVATDLGFGGFGGVLSFEVRGDGDQWSQETFEATGRFVDGLRIPYIAPSLGGCETLVEQVSIMGYFDQPLSARKSLGITNGFIRYAAGIESHHDLIDDIEQALEFA